MRSAWNALPLRYRETPRVCANSHIVQGSGTMVCHGIPAVTHHERRRKEQGSRQRGCHGTAAPYIPNIILATDRIACRQNPNNTVSQISTSPPSQTTQTSTEQQNQHISQTAAKPNTPHSTQQTVAIHITNTTHSSTVAARIPATERKCLHLHHNSKYVLNNILSLLYSPPHHRLDILQALQNYTWW